MYWNFVVLTWLPIYGCIYWIPRLMSISKIQNGFSVVAGLLIAPTVWAMNMQLSEILPDMIASTSRAGRQHFVRRGHRGRFSRRGIVALGRSRAACRAADGYFPVHCIAWRPFGPGLRHLRCRCRG